MLKRIHEQTLAITPLIIALRRDFHKHPESAWCEYRTTSLVARHLIDLGYKVVMGQDAHVNDLRGIVPSPEKARQEQERAISQGADATLVNRMGNGFTGLWADLVCGPAGDAASTTVQGPCIALRFDMDALEIQECALPQHKPFTEGFASTQEGLMHSCGHDGHTALGMGVAAIVKSLQSELRGTVRLIFQPAEEGAHGATPMCAAGAVDNVDILLGVHFGIQAQKTGELICGTTEFLATTTFVAEFSGTSAHAGIAPHQGKNALLAACSAVQGLHAIPRHGQGNTRINVGQIGGGDAGNIIPAHAWIKAETRGGTSELNNYMMQEATRIVTAAAAMWDCTVTITARGDCPSANSDMQVANVIGDIASTMPNFTRIIPNQHFMASEDFTVFLNKVQKQGGVGSYIQMGANLTSGHHTSDFDFDETALPTAMELLARVVAYYLK